MRRRAQRGYALLVVLFFGAVLALTVAISLPRVAFEAQRDKEEDLVYRGMQYARAVQLYYRKFKRYPPSLDALEKQNNIRFLRRRYVDPITKKDEWRVIHMGPMGVFTDSLVYDRPKKKDGEGDTTAANSTDPNQGQTITGIADRLRANAAQGQLSQPGAEVPPGGAVPMGVQPGTVLPGLGQPGYFNVAPGQPNVPVPAFPGGPGSGPRPPGFPPAAAIAGQPPGAFGQPGVAPQPVPYIPGAPPGVPAAGQPGFGQPGFGPSPPAGAFGQPQPPQPQGQSAFINPAMGAEAARIIGQLLTTPRPGGLAGIQPGLQPGTQFGTPAGGMATTFGAGIAGVASKSEARGIKVFQEREKYNEWEFVYDYRKDPLVAGALAAAGTQAAPGQQPGAPGTSGAFGQPGVFGPSGTATQPGMFGQPGAFGQPGVFTQPGLTPINPAQPGLPGSPFGGPRPPTTIITPANPPARR